VAQNFLPCDRDQELLLPPSLSPAGLTARQIEVLQLVAEGLTNAEIADRLIVSQRTAEHHVAAVLTKLGASTRREAARRASELGLDSRPGDSLASESWRS
jgi:DNA-binding NarL/FixJ family response regulator